VLDFCREKGIKLFALPPGLTHILQPVDVGVHRSYKKKLNKALTDFLSDKQILKRANVVSMQATAYEHAFSASNIINSFAKCGIVPFQPQRVLNLPEIARVQVEHDKAQARARQRQIPQHAAQVQVQPMEIDNDRVPDDNDRKIDSILAIPPDPAPSRKRKARKGRGFRSGGLLTSDANYDKIVADKNSVADPSNPYWAFDHSAEAQSVVEEKENLAAPKRKLIRLSERPWSQQQQAAGDEKVAAAEGKRGQRIPANCPKSSDSEESIDNPPRKRQRKRKIAVGDMRERKSIRDSEHEGESEVEESKGGATESDVPSREELHNASMGSRCAACRRSMKPADLASARQCAFCYELVHFGCGAAMPSRRRANAGSEFRCPNCRV
jgi:hypothetical protein